MALNSNINGLKAKVFELPLEDYESTTRDNEFRSLISEIRATEDHEKRSQLKMKLPFRCPHYFRFREDKRAQANILSDQFTWQTCVDIDNADEVDAAISRAYLLNSEEGGKWQGALLHMDRSASNKLHIDIRIPVGKTIREAQEEYTEALDVSFDEACCSPERMIYITDADSQLYTSDQWYAHLSPAEIALRQKAMTDRGLAVDGRPLPGAPVSQTVTELEKGTRESAQSMPSAKTFKGVPYADIISEWWRQHGGEPQESERNIGLHKLAVHLRTICDNRQDVLFEVMPHLGLSDAEVRSIIASATKEQPKGMTAEMKAVLAKLAPQAEKAPLYNSPSTPPEMPAKLPKLIKLLTSKTPNIYKPTVAQAVFPALATHLRQVGFEYIDGVVHEATLMNLLMAETGAGKSCIDKPIKHIMADIAARDKANLAREKKWKDEVNAEGANKKKDLRPKGLVIQQIDADMTNAAFVMRLDESDGHFLYVKLNEIQLFDALKGNGKTGQQFQIMCLAFDPENEYGQTRVGTQSVSAKVKIRFNWNACTTIKEGKLYFSKVLVNGPLSRINICTIPEQPIGSPIPVFGKYDAKFDEELKPYIDNLCAACGDIYCPEAYKLAKKLNEECKVKAIESQSRTYENFTFRANVIAYLKACVLYVANGCKWEKSIEDFIRWSLNYDLWCKMEYFGDAVTQANRFNGPSNNQPKSMLLDLGQTFTRQDVKNLYVQRSMDTNKVGQTIRTWKFRNLIIEQPDGSYKQLKYTG